jgi:hypothetical protein
MAAEQTVSSITNKVLRVVWAPAVVVLSHSALAGLIGHRRELDPLFHFLGGVAGTHAILGAWTAFPQVRSRVAIGHRSQLAIAMVSVAAVLWELAELASDRLVGSRIQLGWSDTGLDLCLGIGGAVVRVFVGGAMVRNENRPA